MEDEAKAVGPIKADDEQSFIVSGTTPYAFIGSKRFTEHSDSMKLGRVPRTLIYEVTRQIGWSGTFEPWIRVPLTH